MSHLSLIIAVLWSVICILGLFNLCTVWSIGLFLMYVSVAEVISYRINLCLQVQRANQQVTQYYWLCTASNPPCLSCGVPSLRAFKLNKPAGAETWQGDGLWTVYTPAWWFIVLSARAFKAFTCSHRHRSCSIVTDIDHCVYVGPVACPDNMHPDQLTIDMTHATLHCTLDYMQWLSLHSYSAMHCL